MRQLSDPRIGEAAESAHQTLSDVAVAGNALHHPFEVGQWLALHARSPQRAVEPLASWLAGGAIERNEDVVEVEIAPRPIVERRGSLGDGQQLVVRGGARHVGRSLAPGTTTIAHQTQRDLSAWKEPRCEQQERRNAKREEGEYPDGG